MHVYLHQIHSLHREASVPALYDAMQNDYLPLMDSYDVALVGYWQTTSIQGTSDETVAVWEFEDYRHLERFARSQYERGGGEPAFDEWQRRQHEWIGRTQGLVCEPCATSPTVEELKSLDVRAAMCSHEIVTTAPYRNAEYGRRLHEMHIRRFVQNENDPKERHLIGLYYAKWSNTVAINIWGDGETWDSVRIWDPEWEKDPNFDLWNTLGREIRSDFYDRFLIPAPFSTVR